MIFFGVVGYMVKKTGFEPGPLVLTFVLGRTLEISFHQSLRIFEGDVTGFLTRPISGPLVALMILVIVILPALQYIRRRARLNGLGLRCKLALFTVEVRAHKTAEKARLPRVEEAP
ncbi:MAG: hypothetical protein M3M97_05065 [Actinomycetota bacterium]|nr:hypothetical protein [Actinomycetota bacterium]